MPVDDLWYRRERGPSGKRVPSQRHGRGKRWRVRYVDDVGRTRTRSFDRRPDAERFDANTRADVSQGRYVDPAAGRVTVSDYAGQWRSAQLWRGSTAEMVERAFRLHILPRLGGLSMGAVRPSHLRGLVAELARDLAPTTVALVYGYATAMFAAAVGDRVIGVTPCTGVRLPAVEREDRFIPTPPQVHALAVALPSRLRGAVYLAAGCGLRVSEVFGLELAHVDFLRRTVTVAQQMASQARHGPFLAPPKTVTSARTVELPDTVAAAVAAQLAEHPARDVELTDRTDPRHERTRTARLLFTRQGGRPVQRNGWSREWRPAVEAAGLPAGFGMHGLRHYYATLLIHAGASVKTVQLALGHATPTITLNTYTHEWPEALDRTRSLVDTALGAVPQTAADGAG